MECITAIDQGTQSTRVLIFDQHARVVAKHQVEFQQINPQSGWTEHDPSVIWESVQTCIKEAVAAATASAGSIHVKAVGITNQRETTLVWDRRTGKPLCNAIVWLDNRTSAICRRWETELGSRDHFRPVTGLPISTYFSAYKFQWMLENVPEVAAAVQEDRCVLGTVDTWLIYNLTGGVDGGVLVTDVTNAARTNLMDLHSLSWHEPTMALFGVQRSMLADIRSNAEVYGTVKVGPLAGVPIAGCLGDQQAAMLGQRCKPGEAKNTYGTGSFIVMNTGTEVVESKQGLLTTMAYHLGPRSPPQYALEGSIAIAGAGISWLRDKLNILESAAECEELAASVPDTAGVYFVPAFSGLLAPHWRPDARGALLGMTTYTSRAHVVRAMLEAICWQTREVMDAMRSDADLTNLKLLRVDGGASVNNLFMQLQADILQVPVQRPGHLETTCLGAAYAAGIGVGFWTQDWVLDDSRKQAEPNTDFLPSVSQGDADRRYQCWKFAVQRSFDLDRLAQP
ncbi:hypothetical protein WJX72_000230 [[Myrmecia] bisecta]|uniref:glycerol kinase n=1 Tax=[Myrmecia] bisecta TaxID=41462 RepID=A0AAW1PZ97_9CHLO